MSLSTVKSIRADPVYQKLKSLSQGIQGTIDLDALEKEARRLHTSRPSRALFKVNMAPTVLWQALATDLSNRARLVEINVAVVRQHQILLAVTEQVRNHIANKYREEISSSASTVAARKEFLDHTLGSASTQIAELQSFTELVQSYIKDIDQASYALGNAVKLLALTVERPNQVV